MGGQLFIRRKKLHAAGKPLLYIGQGIGLAAAIGQRRGVFGVHAYGIGHKQQGDWQALGHRRGKSVDLRQVAVDLRTVFLVAGKVRPLCGHVYLAQLAQCHRPVSSHTTVSYTHLTLPTT